MLKIEYHTRFRRDYRLMKKRGYPLDALHDVITRLVKRENLPPQYMDHPLEVSKHYKDVRECHIRPDWLLVYKIDGDRLILELMRTGTHSDLF